MAKFKVTKEWTVGIVSVVIIGAFVWVAFFFAGRNLLSRENTFYAVFEQTGGLTISGPVAINGKKVGRISEIEFVSPTDHRIRVGMGIKKKYPINAGSTASIESFGLMTGNGIVIYLGESDEFLKSGETLDGRMEPGLLASLEPMLQRLGSILVSVDSLMANVNRIVDDGAVNDLNTTITDLRSSMQNIERLTGRADRLIAENKGKIGEAVDNLSTTMKNVEAISDTLAAADLAGTLASLQGTLESVQQVIDKVNAGEGSVGQLLHNDTLYTNIESVAADLDVLLKDLKENPKRYVHFSLFGRKDKKK